MNTSPPTLVLGLDLATENVGLALVRISDGALYHCEPFRARGEVPDRCLDIARHIGAMAHRPDIADIWAEGIGTRYPAVGIAMGRVHQAVAMAIVACPRWADRPVSQAYGTVQPTELKAHALGKGTGSKADMQRAARERWPHHPFTTDDEADAAWIADYGATRLRNAMGNAA